MQTISEGNCSGNLPLANWSKSVTGKISSLVFPLVGER